MLPGLLFPVNADIEPNDSFVLAEVLAPGTPMNGQLNATDTGDYYKFTVVNGQKIDTDLECVDGDDVWGYLTDTTQNTLESTDYVAPGTNDVRKYTTDRDETGDYYYYVESGGDSNYTLTVTLTNQDDAGSGMDAGNTILDSYPITAGTHDGWIADGDIADFYEFSVTTAQKITVTLNVGTLDTDDIWFYIYDPLKDSIGSSDYLNPGTSETWKYTTSMATAGSYYVKVEGGNNDYELIVALTDQDDAGLSADAADDLTAPTMATLDVEHEGWVADDDVADVYGFNLVDGQIIKFTLKTGTIGTDDLWAYIYGPDKESVGSTDYLNPDVSETFEYTTSYATAGIYYVKVEGGNNNYFFTFTVTDQNDGTSHLDAPDDFTAAWGVNSGAYTGWIFDADEKDYYYVPAMLGWNISFTLTNGHTTTGDDIWAYMYDSAKNKIASTDYLNNDISEEIFYTTSIETAGNYYFLVEGGFNDYAFDVVITHQDDAGTSKDVYGDLTNAHNLVEGTYSGWVADADTQDAYNFTVNAGNIFTLNVTATGATGNIDVDLYDPSKNLITSLSVAVGTTESYELPLSLAPATNSLFYMMVKGGGHTYSLDLVLPTTPPDTTPPAVDILVPTFGSAFKLASITATGTASDDGNIVLVQASIDNSTFVNCTGQGAWTCTLNLSTGANTLTVRATDQAGNIGYDDVTLHLDGVLPTVSINEITNGTRVKKAPLILSGTATDNIGLASVTVTLNGQSVIVAGTGTWIAYMNLTKGDNTIVVTVTDTAGNTNQETMTIIYKKAKKADTPGFEALLFVGAIAVAVLVLCNRNRK